MLLIHVNLVIDCPLLDGEWYLKKHEMKWELNLFCQSKYKYRKVSAIIIIRVVAVIGMDIYLILRRNGFKCMI